MDKYNSLAKTVQVHAQTLQLLIQKLVTYESSKT